MNVHRNGTAPDILPPHSKDAEEALLTAILIDSTKLADIAPVNLTGDDFFIERHRWVFETALEIFHAGQPVGLLSVRDRLGHRLDEAGGDAWLTEFTALPHPISQARYYAEVIKEKANRRRILDLAGQLARLAHNEALHNVETEAATLFRDAAPKPVTGWQIRTLADAYKPRPPVVYIVQGVISLPSLNIIYGAPGTLKSLFLGDMAVCVAAGLPWLEPLNGQKIKARATIKAPVLWLDFDNGQLETEERLEAFGRARNLDPANTPLFYVSMPTPWLNAADPGSMAGLEDNILRLGAKLVVIDNLGTVSGGVDENSSGMIQVMANLRRLAEVTGVALVVIHHQRKTIGNGSKARAGDTLRGHSSIEAALSLALLVERIEESDRITVKATKTRKVSVSSFAAEFTYEHRPNSQELAAARFFGIEQETTALVSEAIREFVTSHPGFKQKPLTDHVCNVTGAAYHFVRGRIKEMADNGEIKALESGRAINYYPNPDYLDF